MSRGGTVRLRGRSIVVSGGRQGVAGAPGPSAYQSYVATTEDDPVLTEEQWSAAFEVTPSVASVYLAKHGSDSSSGLSSNLPKLTIEAALTAAAALITGGVTRATVGILDSGTYEAAGSDITVPAGVSIVGTSATVVGALVLGERASVDFYAHYPKSNGTTMVSATGICFYRAHLVDQRGTGGTFTTGSVLRTGTSSGHILHAEITIAFVASQFITSSDSASAGHIHFRANDIYLAGNNSSMIYLAFARADNIIGYVDHILEFGSPTSTVGIHITQAGPSVRLIAGEIVADTAYDIASGADFYLSCPRIVGTRTGTPANRMLGTADIGTAVLAPNGDGSALTGIVTTPADASITNAKLANMAAGTTKGRAIGSGTGVPVDLTAAQLRLNHRGLSEGLTGTSGTLAITSGVHTVYFTNTLAGSTTLTLPPADDYEVGDFIEVVDLLGKQNNQPVYIQRPASGPGSTDTFFVNRQATEATITYPVISGESVGFGFKVRKIASGRWRVERHDGSLLIFSSQGWVRATSAGWIAEGYVNRAFSVSGSIACDTFVCNNTIIAGSLNSTNSGLGVGVNPAGIGGDLFLRYDAAGRWIATLADGTPCDVKARSFFRDRTDIAAATTGAQTINKAGGSVNFAAAATSLVVTNSLVTSTSTVEAYICTNDATMKSVVAVSASGSFTIYPDAAPTAETRVAFIVH